MPFVHICMPIFFPNSPVFLFSSKSFVHDPVQLQLSSKNPGTAGVLKLVSYTDVPLWEAMAQQQLMALGPMVLTGSPHMKVHFPAR